MLQSELTMAKLKRFDSCIGRPAFSLWNGTSSNIWLSPILMDETSPYVVNQFADFTVDHTLQAGFAETEISQVTQRETTCLFPRVSRTEQKSCGFILKSLHNCLILIWQLSVPNKLIFEEVSTEKCQQMARSRRLVWWISGQTLRPIKSEPRAKLLCSSRAIDWSE